MTTIDFSQPPQHTIVIVKNEQQEQSILAKAVGSLMLPTTVGACAFVLVVYGPLQALGCGIGMSIATKVLQKSIDALVDAAVFTIKLPFKVIAYPFTSESSKTEQLAQQIFKKHN